MRAILPSLVLAMLLGGPACGSTAADCPVRDDAPALNRLRTAMARGRFVAYEPTALTVVDGRFTAADPASVRADLSVLRRQFDGLITYDAIHGAENVAPIAAELGFRALIIGVWDPTHPDEISAALEAARRFPTLVVGLSLGNERVFARTMDAATLAALVRSLRGRLPGLPLSSTEPFHILEQPDSAALLHELDFVLVNVHPVFQSWFHAASAATAAQFVVNVLKQLAPLGCGPLIVKETGVPTEPASAGFSETRQALFYQALRARLPPTTAQTFAYFAAFDEPWRAHDASPVPGSHPEEAHWGLFDAQRVPKAAARALPPLAR
jgi:exo-beta-1,3-glucanase (GH17 family)